MHYNEAKQANEQGRKSAHPDTMHVFQDTKADGDRKPSINSANKDKLNELAAPIAQ